MRRDVVIRKRNPAQFVGRRFPSSAGVIMEPPTIGPSQPSELIAFDGSLLVTTLAAMPTASSRNSEAIDVLKLSESSFWTVLVGPET
jgi:hypothetical protein